MFLIREIMYCKPGKVRAMVEKFVAMSKISEKAGMPRMRVMTDFAAERYWTVVAEMEVPDLQGLRADDVVAGGIERGHEEDGRDHARLSRSRRLRQAGDLQDRKL